MPARRRIVTVALASLSVAGSLGGVGCGAFKKGSSAANPAPHQGQPAQGQMTDEQMWAEMMTLAEPGPQHEALDPLVGRFTYTMSHTDESGNTVQDSAGTCEARWVMGGRFVMSYWTGTMDMAGQSIPWEGTGIIGHDNIAGEYVGTWTDTFTTSILVQQGAMTGDQLTLEGPMPSPMGDMTFRGVWTISGPQGFTMDMYQTDPATGQMHSVGQLVAVRVN